MRQLQKNKRRMFYSNFVGLATVTQGYTECDEELIPVKVDAVNTYTEPTEFYANLSENTGQTYEADYGLQVGQYNAVISANKGELPFREQTLIWHKSEPKKDAGGNVIPESADYRVIAIKTSLNAERFILKARETESNG